MKQQFTKNLNLGYVLTALLLGFLCAHVQASDQIYRCQLEDGRFQFQQTACSDDQVAGDSDAHKAWRKMRVLGVEGQSILQRLGPDVESIQQCNADIRRFQGKLNSVNKLLRNVKQAEHPALFKSYSYLQECAECRTSAASSCQQGGRYLDKAMQNLMKVQ
jgi:hypothetical protein